MSTHKRWKTVNWPSATERRHTSQRKAYEYVTEIAEDARLGMTRVQQVVVWFAEGKQPWQCYERVTLPQPEVSP